MRPQYFLPEWDDLVDPSYDFQADQHSAGRSGWAREVYAHELYGRPNCDGLLVSRVVAEKTADKKAGIRALGVHGYFRVPAEFPVFGDCGAFGYIDSDEPPYSTDDSIDYYTRLRVTYGVSVDHLIVASTHEHRARRYELTISNADTFLRRHRLSGASWHPVGAVQGWDEGSYVNAALACVKQGYDYIALGGLVRTPTRAMLPIIEAVRRAIPDSVRIHLFGVSRMGVIGHAKRLRIASFDSASVLRRAWLGSGQNYLTPSGDWYAAIRVPQVGKSFRAKRIVSEGRASEGQIARLEAQALRALRDYGATKGPSASLSRVLDAVMEYDNLIDEDRPVSREQMSRTLADRPWAQCPCAICKSVGIEVVIFRGNNRNRRRGFHNTWAFYQGLDQAWSS